MSNDPVGCEWVSVSSGTGLPGLSQTKAVERLCVCVLHVSDRNVKAPRRDVVCKIK